MSEGETIEGEFRELGKDGKPTSGFDTRSLRQRPEYVDEKLRQLNAEIDEEEKNNPPKPAPDAQKWEKDRQRAMDKAHKTLDKGMDLSSEADRLTSRVESEIDKMTNPPKSKRIISRIRGVFRK
jgi:hypothetical protein